MTVSSDIQSVVYDTDGITVGFPIPFYFLRDEDVEAFLMSSTGALRALVLGSDFTLTGAGAQSGGLFSSIDVFATGSKLRIYRIVPVTQESKYQQNDAFPAATTEKALDKLTMIAQQIAASVIGSLRYPIAELGSDGTLPAATDRAGNVLGFDANGAPTMLPIPASVGAGDMRVDVFVEGTDFIGGETTTLTLSRAPGNKDNVEFHFDAAYQGPDQYGINGAQAEFTSAIPEGIERVYAKIGTTLSLSLATLHSVGDKELSWGTFLNRVCDSVGEMASLDATIYKRATVAGLNTIGDGFGGDFYYEAGVPHSLANGVQIVASFNSPGCWISLTIDLPQVIKQLVLTGQAAPITVSTPLFSPIIAGLFRVSTFLSMEAGAGSGTLTPSISFNDGFTTRTVSGPAAAATAGGYSQSTDVIYSVVAPVAYGVTAAGISGAYAYSLRVTVERLS